MSDPRFLQTGFEARLAHVVEKCSEVLAAAGKTKRWGAGGVNPLIPSDQQERNADRLWREMADLEDAMARLRTTMLRLGMISHD